MLRCVGCSRSIGSLVLVRVASVASFDLVGRAALFFVVDALFGFILFFVVPAARLGRGRLFIIEI